MKNPYLLWISVAVGFLFQVFSSYLSAVAFLNGDWAGGIILFCLVLLLGFGIVILVFRFRRKKGPKDSSLQGRQDGPL